MLGNKIVELRKKAKLSQEQLTEKIDVTRQTIEDNNEKCVKEN